MRSKLAVVFMYRFVFCPVFLRAIHRGSSCTNARYFLSANCLQSERRQYSADYDRKNPPGHRRYDPPDVDAIDRCRDQYRFRSDSYFRSGTVSGHGCKRSSHRYGVFPVGSLRSGTFSSFQRESRGRPHSAKVSTVQRNPAQDLSSRTAFHPDHLHHLFYGYDTEQPASQSIGTADIGAWCLLPFAVLCFHADLRDDTGAHADYGL